ncbi:MAG: hypothetical protein QOC92_4027 [Acidimicrobiaceae bacterium]|jgi:plastocyanin
MTRRWLALVAVGVVVLAACSSDNKKSATSAASSSGGGAQTVPVGVDAKVTGTPVAFTTYFPNDATLHAGDTIDFKETFTGEPHTVTFGTLVDQGLAKLDPNAQDEPAELKKIPDVFPQGPGDATQVSAQPCFLATGDPPASDACSKDQQKQPEFDGTQTYYNSGFLADGDHFKVTLAKTIKPGTYNYFCVIHRGGMTGKITIVAADAKAQTADEVKKAGDTAVADAVTKIKPIIDAIKAGTLPPFIPAAAPGSVIAGGGSQDQPGTIPTLFGPDKANVKVGDTVTWTVVGPHTISFGASEALSTYIAKAPDGAVHLTADSFKPAGGAGQPQGPPGGGGAASGPPGPPTPIDGASFDGTGLHNSGLILSFPPNLFSYSVKFTKAGTFDYKCLIHPDMKGTVNVT